MNLDTIIIEEIVEEVEALKKMELGSEQHKVTVDSIAKLADKAIEMQKIENEQKEREKNEELKQMQVKNENIDRVWRNGIAIAGIVIPAGLTVWGVIKSLKFETEGTVTSIVGRGLINKLLPKK